MSTLIILLLCGAAGGFIFEWFGLPGGDVYKRQP